MCSLTPSKFNCVKKLYPYLLNGLKSGILMAAGDMLAQTYIEDKEWNQLNRERSAKFAIIGLTFTGPLLFHWSSIMRKSINPSSSTVNKAIYKTLSTQIFLAPALNFGIITLAKTLNSFKPSKTGKENILKEDFLTVMEKNYIVWLPTQLAGHVIQCPSVKFVIINAISIFWFCHLSTILMGNRKTKNKRRP